MAYQPHLVRVRCWHIVDCLQAVLQPLSPTRFLPSTGGWCLFFFIPTRDAYRLVQGPRACNDVIIDTQKENVSPNGCECELLLDGRGSSSLLTVQQLSLP